MSGVAFQYEWADEGDWRAAHEQLLRLARTRAGLDFEEGRWLVAALRSGAHLRLGYGSFAEYVERLLGYGARLVQDKLRVAEALETLPVLAQTLKSGAACWSVLRELTRVATPETEREWLDAAQGRTVREVEKLVSGRGPGSRPTDAREAELVRHVLRFEVSGDVLASFREALGKLRREAGEPLDDDAALLLMARQVLQGPRDEGRASYQVALTVCEHCKRGQQQGRGEAVDVAAEVVEMASCDAQHLGHISEGDGATRADAPKRRGCAQNGAEARVDAHVGVTPAPRATQSIPPAIRRLVLRRDGGRCVFPGCRHATFVDVHHLKARERGGKHRPENLITLCGAHHRAVHRGRITVERVETGALRFRHADGSTYGRPASPGSAAMQAKAFQALRELGFGEAEVRRALEKAPHVGNDQSLEQVVRQCLHVLTERSAQKG